MPNRVIEDVVCAHTNDWINNTSHHHTCTHICTCSLKDVDVKESLRVAVLTVFHA